MYCILGWHIYFLVKPNLSVVQFRCVFLWKLFNLENCTEWHENCIMFYLQTVVKHMKCFKNKTKRFCTHYRIFFLSSSAVGPVPVHSISSTAFSPTAVPCTSSTTAYSPTADTVLRLRLTGMLETSLSEHDLNCKAFMISKT